MNSSEVTIVETGVANLASVITAFEKLGCPIRLSHSAQEIDSASHVVLPGVGSFGAAMEKLQRLGLVDTLRRRFQLGHPTLAICLGLQLLCETSEESTGVRGLGVIAMNVQRLQPGVRVPHMGWNKVMPSANDSFVEAGHAYFANSYCLARAPDGWSATHVRHGQSFVAAIEKGNVLACQFHPELSGTWGQSLLQRWIRGKRISPVSHTWTSERLGVRVIPCLDVRDGKVVKGVRFENLRTEGDPVEFASAYENQGADELVVLDVSATLDARRTALETVRKVRKNLSIPLTVGGGVRSIEDAAALLDAGADKVAVNSAAVVSPDLINQLAERFGRQCIVVSIDAKATGANRWQVMTRSGSAETGLDVSNWAEEVARRGAGEILLTSLDRDGTQCGYDLD